MIRLRFSRYILWAHFPFSAKGKVKEEESLTADHLLAEQRGRITPKTIDMAPLVPCWTLSVRVGLGGLDQPMKVTDQWGLQPSTIGSSLLPPHRQSPLCCGDATHPPHSFSSLVPSWRSSSFFHQVVRKLISCWNCHTTEAQIWAGSDYLYSPCGTIGCRAPSVVSSPMCRRTVTQGDTTSSHPIEMLIELGQFDRNECLRDVS